MDELSESHSEHKSIEGMRTSHAVLSDLFQAIASAPGFNIDKNIDNLSANIMEETLLNVSFLSFQVIMDDKIVKYIDLGDTY